MTSNKVSVTIETLEKDIRVLELKRKNALTRIRIHKSDETDAKQVKKTLNDEKRKIDNRRKKLEADERKLEANFNQVEERINKTEINIMRVEEQLNALETEHETKSKILKEITDKEQEKKKRIEAIEAEQKRLEAEKKKLLEEESDEEEKEEETEERVAKITFEGVKYLKSLINGAVYDYKAYTEREEQIVVGRWDEEKITIVFAKAESDEEEEYEEDSEVEDSEIDDDHDPDVREVMVGNTKYLIEKSCNIYEYQTFQETFHLLQVGRFDKQSKEIILINK